jgi:hypothetical protein
MNREFGYLLWWLFTAAGLYILKKWFFTWDRASRKERELILSSVTPKEQNSIRAAGKISYMICVIVGFFIFIIGLALLQSYYFFDKSAAYSFVFDQPPFWLVSFFFWFFLAAIPANILPTLLFWPKRKAVMLIGFGNSGFGQSGLGKLFAIIGILGMVLEFGVFGSYAYFYQDTFVYKTHFTLQESSYRYSDITSITLMDNKEDDRTPYDYYEIKMKDGGVLVTYNGHNGMMVGGIFSRITQDELAHFLSERSNITIVHTVL